jgi:hypothetical protein
MNKRESVKTKGYLTMKCLLLLLLLVLPASPAKYALAKTPDQTKEEKEASKRLEKEEKERAKTEKLTAAVRSTFTETYDRFKDRTIVRSGWLDLTYDGTIQPSPFYRTEFSVGFFYSGQTLTESPSSADGRVGRARRRAWEVKLLTPATPQAPTNGGVLRRVSTCADSGKRTPGQTRRGVVGCVRRGAERVQSAGA